jgi:L-malate glycosyltransferase
VTVAPVRVLWLVKGLGIGGIERLLCWWSAHRDAGEVDSRVAYALDGLDALAPTLLATGTPVTNLGGRHTLDPRWVRQLRRLLVEEPVDVVHAHAPDLAAVAYVLGRTLPADRRPRIVATDHTVWSDYRRPARLALHLTGARVDAHLAVSEAVRQSAPRHLQERIEVLVPGVPVRAIRAGMGDREMVRTELGAGPHHVVVMTLANYRPAKRYPDMLRAVALAMGAGCPIIFAAVGSGPLERELKKLAVQLGIADRVRILGLREDAIGLLAGADVFILASDHEGGPLAVLEAMVAGVPVIATPVGVVPEVITDGGSGLIVPVGRPERLCDAIVALAGDKRRRVEMGLAAARRAELLDVSVSSARLATLYRSLAPSVRSRRTG